jgi:hypothetical protein
VRRVPQNYYAPQMFQELGMNNTESSLFATGIYGVVKVVACLGFLIFAADSLGRRKSLMWTSIAMSISMFVIGVYMYISPPIEGQPVSYNCLSPRYTSSPSDTDELQNPG